MVISVGSDHAGYGLKVKMIPYLESLGHTIIDNGNNGAEDVVFFRRWQGLCAGRFLKGRRNAVLCFAEPEWVLRLRATKYPESGRPLSMITSVPINVWSTIM